jgi:hypothetical protein
MQETSPVDLERLCDLRTPWCIHVAVTLRIAEHIAAGVEELGGLASAAQCDARALGMVLRHLVSMGLFTERQPDRFALNDAAQQLTDAGVRVGLDLEGIGGRMAHVWGTLLTFVRTGEPAFAERFGRPFWEDLDANPAVRQSFDDLIGPTGHGRPNGVFEIPGGWDTVRTVVDVGGGTGALLAEILKARPEVRGILVDLPSTVARAGAIFREAGVEDRASVVGRSFFEELPSGADLYILKGVLNDWPDRDAEAILRRCANAAGSTGQVVVMGVAASRGREDLTIEIILCGGRHRSREEFQDLGALCGLQFDSGANGRVFFRAAAKQFTEAPKSE